MRSFAVTIGILGLFTAGCGSAGSPAPAERADLNGELATVTQNLGEATCGTLPADETWDFMGPYGGAGTADGNYGHPTCTDGYIVDVLNVPAGGNITGGAYLPRWPDPFTCLLAWGYMSLWQKSGTGYVRLTEISSLGFLTGINGVCSAGGTVTASTAGDYRVVAAAGWLFGPKQAVTIRH